MDEWRSWQDICPYCGESIELLMDAGFTDSSAELRYIEDCQVCCRPITVCVRIDSDGEIQCELKTETDT